VSDVWLHPPAKVNLTLEVLGKRSDGYHEIRSVMHAIDPRDQLTLDTADELTLRVYGGPSFRRRPAETNLVFQAAELLRERAGRKVGARITLTKQIPLASGLGGGSSDAAATLLALRVLWELDVSDEELADIGANLGSDVPFFLRGGTVIASGRGNVIEPLPDVAQHSGWVAWPPRRSRPDKTARMYAALRPEHYTDGSRTERLAERIRRGEPFGYNDLFNVFEAVIPEIDPEGAQILRRARELGSQPLLCGSGPALFFISGQVPDDIRVDTITAAEAIPAAECTRIYGEA